MGTGHSQNPGFVPGDHWVECPVCGFDYRSSEMRRRWDGQWVCKDDWETRHPQDFVRGRADKISADEPVYPPDDSNVVELEYAEELPEVPTGTFDNSL